MEDPKNGYVIRSFPGDALPLQFHNLVLSKWMRSYRYGNDYIKLTESGAYFEAYSRYISLILLRPNSMVHLALLADDRDVALGFCVTEVPGILHYVHVHKDHRQGGIGSKLVFGTGETTLDRPIKSFTHLTRIGMKLWPTKLPNATFNPFG